MIRNRKLGHQHKLTVPTIRKGVGVAQAGRQVAQNKATINQPGADYTEFGKGGNIHINPANKGKFTATKKATGKSTEELTHSSNPVTRKRAIFAQNARKWHHHANGGWIQEYTDGGKIFGIQSPLPDSMDGYYGMSGQQYMIPIQNDVYKRKNAGKQIGLKFDKGGRIINPVTGGLMIGGQHAYPPTVQYPPEYGFGGVLQSFAPFLSLIPGVGSIASAAAGAVGGVLENQTKAKQNENKFVQQDKASDNPYVPTFSWGGRLPETRSFSPSGLTLGHVPGYDDNSNYGGTEVPPQGWNYRMIKGNGEIKNWSQDTMANVHRHQYGEGGEVPVELEKQEVYQEPDGDMGQVNGPSHEEGGVKMQLPENSFIWSDKLKASSGRTFADEAAKLARMKEKYERILGKQ